MTESSLPFHLKEKLFEIRFESDELISRIVSYFPLSESERAEIRSALSIPSFDGFHSIFTDTINQEEWDKTKEQIKKRFGDELFDVDGMS